MFSEQMNKTVRETFNRKPVKGEFGIEIETEGANLFPGGITKTFTAHEDGSLRRGMEYVSKPIGRKDILWSLNELKEVLLRNHCTFEPSYRASTHIHQNYLDNTWGDVLGSIVGWTLVEPVVFEAMPPGRSGSLFCMSAFDTGDAVGALNNLCHLIETAQIQYQWNYRGKYSAQNLLRLADLGTIEYRVFPTSMDGNQIDMWCGWLENVKDQAVKAQDRSFLEMVEYAEKNPLDFCGRIFEGKIPIDHDRVPALVDFGARHAYELARLVAKYIKKPAPKIKSKTAGTITMDDIVPVDANFRGDNHLENPWVHQAVGGMQWGIQPIIDPVAPQPIPAEPAEAPNARRVFLVRAIARYTELVNQVERINPRPRHQEQRLVRRRATLARLRAELENLDAR